MYFKKIIVLLSTLTLSFIFSISMLDSIPTNTIAAAETSCISYNSKVNEIFISCKYVEFKDIENSIQDKSILYRESGNVIEKNWILNAGITVNKDATLSIDSDDVTWLKIVPGLVKPNAIKVDGSLELDSVKITSWNPQTNDYVRFSEATKYDKLQYMKELRPYIKVNSGATGPTIIQNSELAYLGYSCNGCGGISFNGGEYSVLKNNDIHHIYKGFYSKDIGYILIEGNRVYENEKYGIDPHSGTHHMIIRNNTVYNNYNAGIICSADCYDIIIEENKVYNNGHGDFMRGIAISKNVYDSIIRKNIVSNEDICISIGRDSHDNKIYNNVLSNCLNGVNVTKNSFNNEIYNNKIEKVGYGLVADDLSNNNVFHSNIVIDAEIGLTFEDETSIKNTFENNKKIVSFATLKEKEKESK